jgi:hypothetical protein
MEPLNTSLRDRPHHGSDLPPEVLRWVTPAALVLLAYEVVTSVTTVTTLGRGVPVTVVGTHACLLPFLWCEPEGVLRICGDSGNVRVIFRRMHRMGNLGPRGLDPADTLELRGNGGGRKRATVETTLKVRDEHEPGDYLCVAIQAYDSDGSMVMIKNPKPSKLFRIVDLGNKDDHKMEFLGWGED